MSVITDRNTSVCIEATAGSGKTTLMVQRLRDLVVHKRVPPDQCLAITFTDKAAKEMTDRLIDLFENEPSVTWPITTVEKMQISTIHSFCQTILKKYALSMDFTPHYRIINSIEKQDLIQQSFKDLIKKYSHKPPEWLHDCLSIWTQDQLEQICMKAYDHRDTITYWLDNGFYDIPDDILSQKPIFTEMITKKYDHLKTLINECLSNIEKTKQQNLILDYDDLLYRTYQLLSNVDWLRHQLQQQKQYIFVDEFQDTSPVQWKIVQLLCHDDDPFSANKLWIVGDRCQAIYGFRGADDHLMEMVVNSNHNQLEHIKNTNNYRSHPVIINFINSLFNRLFQAKGETFLNMEPKKESSESASIQLKIVHSEEPKQEFEEIEAMIHQWRSDGYGYSDIAILVRKNYDIKRIKEYFTPKNIPLQISKGAGLCELDSVQVIISFLQGMLDPANDTAWLSIATDILGIPNSHLSRGIDETIKDKVNHRYPDQLEEWEQQIQIGPLGEQLCACVYQLPLSNQFSEQDKQAIQQFLTAFESAIANSEHPIQGALNWLDYCIKHPKMMGIDQDQQLDAIQVMTLHAAKGLEFPIVIVPFLDAQFNFGATDPLIISRHKGLGLSMPGLSKENIIRKEIFEQQKHDGILEEIRLFYVTLTRAKQHLALTGKQLKRRNVSRLSLCLPYLEERKNGELDFSFNYQKHSPGTPINREVIEETHYQEQLQISDQPLKKYYSFLSISTVLDILESPKLAAQKKFRPETVTITSEQDRGNRYHQWMAKALIKSSDKDPEFLSFTAKLQQQHWFQDLISHGRFIVEFPFEYQFQDHVIRGRFDAVWFDDKQKIIKVLEFKLSIGKNLTRYSNQIKFYGDILSDRYPDYQIQSDGLLLIDFQTFSVTNINSTGIHIHDVVNQLPKSVDEFFSKLAD